MRLRELYPTDDRVRLETCSSSGFIDRLVREVTTGFKGDVGVVPRQFLREFVTQLGLVDENPEYDPAAQYGFKLKEPIRPEEQLALTGAASPVDDAEELIPQEDAW